jgi:hypothetical protein
MAKPLTAALRLATTSPFVNARPPADVAGPVAKLPGSVDQRYRAGAILHVAEVARVVFPEPPELVWCRAVRMYGGVDESWEREDA